MIRTKNDLRDYLQEDFKYYKIMPGLKEKILKTERYYSVKFVKTLTLIPQHYSLTLFISA